MADNMRFTLSEPSEFILVPEGKTVFRITKCEYLEKYNKLKVTMEASTGAKVQNTYIFKTEGALKAFSYFARTALHNYRAKDIDFNELEGCYIGAEVYHSKVESTTEPGKILTFANTRNYYEAYGYEDGTIPPEIVKDEVVDLDDILNS